MMIIIIVISLHTFVSCAVTANASSPLTTSNSMSPSWSTINTASASQSLHHNPYSSLFHGASHLAHPHASPSPSSVMHSIKTSHMKSGSHPSMFPLNYWRKKNPAGEKGEKGKKQTQLLEKPKLTGYISSKVSSGRIPTV